MFLTPEIIIHAPTQADFDAVLASLAHYWGKPGNNTGLIDERQTMRTHNRHWSPEFIIADVWGDVAWDTQAEQYLND